MSSLVQELQEECKESKTYYTGTGYLTVHPDLWVIHGNYYDLTPFLPTHPGGEENLRLGKGRDCTELFESVHSLSHINMTSLLQKYKVPIPEGYEVPSPAGGGPFTWEKGGFYDTLKTRVRDYFDNNTKGNHKADGMYWVKIAIFITLYISLMILSVTTGSVILPILAALVNSMMGFGIMHDASHYGVSKKPWVNQLMHTVWCNWNLWPHFNWMIHHVYGHHSYTGIHTQDPDLINASNFQRKHPNTSFQKRYETQHIHAWFLMMFAPNQHIGQALMYIKALRTWKVFDVPLGKIATIDFVFFVPIYLTSLYVHFVLPFYYMSVGSAFLMMLTYWTVLGILYMVNVIPNHDTIDTHKSAIQEGELRDWGAQQVLSTGNHSTDGGLWSRIVASLFGGMNYQIEHHLFPSVSHVHYPAVGKIVKQTCEEYNINYVTHSWLAALWRYSVLLWVLSFPQVGMPEGQKKRDE